MAANKYIGATHLAGSTVGTLQRKNNFLVEIGGLPETVTFLVKDISLPQISNDVIEVKYGNSKIKLPGAASVSEGKISFHDSIDLDTERVLLEWRNRVYNPKTKAIAKDGYKVDAIITEFSPDGATGRQWKMENVWPSQFNPGELTNEDSGLKDMDITLQSDNVYRIDVE